jgi:hypothetical protein
MNKFSIAPWKSAIAFDRAYIRNIKDAQGEIIAQIPDWEDGLEETTANARLMAAAPDLLAALRDLLDEADLNEVDEYTAPKIEAARAAIARATGDQTVNV